MVQKILQKKRKKDEKETFFGRKRNGNRLYRCVEWGKDPKIKRKRGKRMRQLRRLLSVLVMAVTIVGMSVTAFAQESVSGAGGNGSITIKNASKGIHYTIYKKSQSNF